MRYIFLILILFITASCGRYPKDVEGTLDQVMGKRLLAGVTSNPPYIIIKGDEVTGMEADIIMGFARSLKAEVEWIIGSEEYILTMLESGRIHLAAGGFNNKSVWKKHVHFARPHDTLIYRVGVPAGGVPPDDLKGLQVHMVKGNLVGKKLSREATMMLKDSLAGDEPLVIDSEKELIRRGYVVSEKKLKKVQISLAIQKGENAFLKELDAYISNYEKKIKE